MAGLSLEDGTNSESATLGRMSDTITETPSETTTRRTIRCLERAKVRIEQQDKVLQYAFFSGDLVCTSGALSIGEGSAPWYSQGTESHRAVGQTIVEENDRYAFDGEVTSICGWNNEPGRTVEDISTLFQRTIDRLERQDVA